MQDVSCNLQYGGEGVSPLVRAQGPGVEMRRVLGVAVFSGMLGVMFFGVFLAPVFYSLIERWLLGAETTKQPPPRKRLFNR